MKKKLLFREYVDDPGDDSVEAPWQIRMAELLEQEDVTGDVHEQLNRHVWSPAAIVGKANDRTARKGLGVGLTRSEWRDIVVAMRSKCAYCGQGTPFPILEHVVPVCQGGATDAYNVLPACRSCNAAKRGRDPFQWMRRDPAALDAFLARVLTAAGHL